MRTKARFMVPVLARRGVTAPAPTPPPGPAVREYDTYAIARAIDPVTAGWNDGDTIRITDPDPNVDFLYDENFGTSNGHNGLVHANPYGDATDLTNLTQVDAEGASTDPSGWGWSAAPAPDVMSVDSGRSLLASDSGPTQRLLRAVGATTEQTIVVTRDHSAASNGVYGYMSLNATSDDGANRHSVGYAVELGTNSTYWVIDDGTWDPLPLLLGASNEYDLYCYVTTGKYALWNGATLIASGTPVSEALSAPNCASFVGAAFAAPGYGEMRLSTIVVGSAE